MTSQSQQLVAGLIQAYRRGLFPMADAQTGSIGLYDPDPRAILPLCPRDGLHLPRRLVRTVRAGRFTITSDRSFDRVVAACAAPRTPTPASLSVSAETWISEDLAALYGLLHRAGRAHSVEAWLETGVEMGGEPELVGGIFGVCVGAVFCGESMMSRPDLGGTDASKVCLVHTIAHLRKRGVTLFDTQMVNPHIEQFGCVEIPRTEYHRRLARALDSEPGWGAFDANDPQADLAQIMHHHDR